MVTPPLSDNLQQKLCALQKSTMAYIQLGIAENSYPPEFRAIQRALDQLVFLLDIKRIEDEELYKIWKNYEKERSHWHTETLPAYKASTAENLLELVLITKQHLVVIIAAANLYLQNYEAHQEKIVGETMQKRFKVFQEQAQEELHAPKQGWLYIQKIIAAQHQELILEQQALATLKGYTKAYKELLQEWNNRVLPNSKALLNDQQDLNTGQELLAVLKKMETFLTTAPKSVQDIAERWSNLIVSKKWDKRILKLQDYYKRSQDRQETELGEDGNPKLAAGVLDENYQYKAPNKKEELYQKGKGDPYAIAANDVQQGDLDNCYVLSPIAALAQSDPEAIKKLIEVQKDGAYKVTLHLRTRADSMEREQVEVVVKNEFVRDKAGKAAYAGMGDKELWVQVLEKAYAQALGSYDDIAEGGDASEVLEVFTGKKAIRVSLKGKVKEEVLPVFEAAVKSRTPVVVSSIVLKDRAKRAFIDNDQFIVTNHAYYLSGTDDKIVSLKNPLGKDHLEINWEILFEYFIYYSKL